MKGYIYVRVVSTFKNGEISLILSSLYGPGPGESIMIVTVKVRNTGGVLTNTDRTLSRIIMNKSLYESINSIPHKERERYVFKTYPKYNDPATISKRFIFQYMTGNILTISQQKGS